MRSAELHRENREASGEESYGRFLYNRFRNYDPAVGRYISADPAGQIMFEGKPVLGVPEVEFHAERRRWASLVGGVEPPRALRLVGVNAYVYANLNPAVFVDPTGLGPVRTAVVQLSCIAAGCAAGFFGGGVSTPVGCAIGGVVGFGANAAWDAWEFDESVNQMSEGAGDLIKNRGQQADDASNGVPINTPGSRR